MAQSDTNALSRVRPAQMNATMSQIDQLMGVGASNRLASSVNPANGPANGATQPGADRKTGLMAQMQQQHHDKQHEKGHDESELASDAGLMMMGAMIPGLHGLTEMLHVAKAARGGEPGTNPNADRLTAGLDGSMSADPSAAFKSRQPAARPSPFAARR